MKRAVAMTSLCGLAAVMTVAASPVGAQEVNLSTLDDGEANRVYVRTGAEYGFVAGVGYARTMRLFDRTLLLSGEVTAPWANVDESDGQGRVGVLVPIVASRRWRLAGSFAPTVRGTKNELGRMGGVSADFGLTGGWYARRWFVAGELGFDWAISTYVAHSDQYRQNVYPDARDGWYYGAGGNVRTGLQTGASFGKFDVVLRMGGLRDVGGEAPLLPFYGTLAFGTRW